MSAKKAIEREIGRYLETVAASLGDMPADEKDDILRDIESHIYAALEKCGPEPSVDDLNVVLAGMDRPSAYARSVEGAGTVARQARFCRIALAAAALFAIVAMAFPVAYIAWEVEAVNPVKSYWSFVWFVSLPLSLIGMFACTLFGFAAVSKIRASRGAFMGLLPAVFAVLVWPIIGLNLGVIVTANMVLDNTLPRLGDSGIAYVAVIFVTLAAALGLIVVLTVWIPRSFWKWANRPISDGEIA